MEIRREDGYPVIGMILGDGSGVGPEITAKLAGKGVLTDGARPMILGDGRLWEYAAGKFAPGVSWHVFEKAEDVDWEHGLPVLHVGEQKPEDIVFGQVNPICGKACLDMLRFAVRLYLDGVIDGVCYAPLNKAAMKLAGNPAASETELFAQLLHQDGGYGEINMLDQVWTARVTSHIPVKDISQNLTVQGIAETIELMDTTLRRAGYESPEIGVCALNPHGGEGGLCGDEEIRVIAPAVELAKKSGICVSGPYPADTLFIQAFDGKFKGIVTMFHDQGQIALKLRGFERGITIGGGLRMPAATCAHGTAHDIAWRGIANPHSLENAYGMIRTMCGNKIGAKKS